VLQAPPAGASSGGGVWGSISGTLSAQTDLQTALNGKEASGAAATAQAVAVARGNHTGTQLAATISDFSAAADARVVAGTAGKVLAAGSATAGSWPVLPSGTLLTAPEAGAIERDANCFYMTTDAGNRGVVPVRHFIRCNATRTLPNDTNENPIFDSPANGRLTLETGTYLFDMVVGITAMSATSGNAMLDIRGAGTATVNDWLYAVVGKDGTLISIAAVLGTMPVIESTPASMFTAGTGQQMWFTAKGTFTVTAAGTLIPSIDQVTAAAAVVAIGSYFSCERIGDVNVVSVGQWD
jgi:hypothetical protein